MHVELYPLSRIRPYSNNPRNNDVAVHVVAASIREYGFLQPLVVDRDFVIVVGDTRYKAAHKLGLKEVPVHVAKDLTPEQIKAYRIADNQSATFSFWNEERLIQELLELQQLNFDLAKTAFPQEELTRLLEPPGSEGFTDADEVPEFPDQAAIAAARKRWTDCLMVARFTWSTRTLPITFASSRAAITQSPQA